MGNYEFYYIIMKKYDKEYSTQHTPEKEYLFAFRIGSMTIWNVF